MRIAVSGVVALLLCLAPAGLLAQETPQLPAATPTLGEFAQRVATSLNLTAPAAGWTPESAAWALVGKGIVLKGELSSPLTEEAAASALVGLGYRVRTTTPSRVLSRDRLDVLLEVFFTATK